LFQPKLKVFANQLDTKHGDGENRGLMIRTVGRRFMRTALLEVHLHAVWARPQIFGFLFERPTWPRLPDDEFVLKPNKPLMQPFENL
jgi:hypothetical protein